MGLDYGFDIFCHRDKLWSFIDSVVELAPDRDGRTTRIISENKETLVPLWCPGGASYDLNDLDIDQSFCLSIPFVVDDAIQRYIKKQNEDILRQDPNAQPWVPELDTQGRINIGCIYFYVVRDQDAIGRTGFDPGLIAFEFRAATTDMSRLFQQSHTIQQTFLELAKKNNATYCLFYTGAPANEPGGPTVMWLDGREYSVLIPGDWLPMDEVRKIVSSITDK